MKTGTVIAFRDDVEPSQSEVALRNGDHVLLTLGRNGLVIKRASGGGPAGEILFAAEPDLASRICAGLVRPATEPTLLRILVATLLQLGSADEVAKAFGEAAAQVS